MGEWNESRKLGLNVRKVEVIYILYSQLFLSHLEESDTLIKKKNRMFVNIQLRALLDWLS